MIEKITVYSVRNPFVIIVATLAALVFGVYSAMNTPVDAIPDLSENQVIVFTDWMGRSPREIEDQITYPLSVNLQGLAGVKAIRSTSEFNFSMINIIFDDSVDYYFARTRVLERLSIAGTFLPPGVVPYLSPDATALGQVFWYTVEGEGYDLARLRAIQDWYVRYQLNAVAGVAQVSTVGGFAREYQVDVDPAKLRALGITLGSVFGAVARSNSAVGGKVIQENGSEFLIRGVGWIRDVKDIESIVLGERGGTPIYVRNVATVQVGPEFRRSVLEKDGNEVTGGVVMMRYGENPLEVTRRIKEKIEGLSRGLPAGVRIVPFYERTRLITDAIHTISGTLTEAIVTSSIAVILVMRHVGSILVICVTLPLALLTALSLMYLFGIPSNIMSLSGIAISIGVLVDSSIVMAENASHELTRAFPDHRVRGDTTEIVASACRLVGRPIFFSVMIMLISFLPVFALGGLEGKMFHPLALTKSFALVAAAILSITLVPALCPLFLRGRLYTENESWLTRSFIEIYRPVMAFLMPHPKLVAWFFLVLVALGFNLWGRLGREFMPPLDEGAILDMPTSIPRISITQAGNDLKERDAVIGRFPEVRRVVGKAGRADTPTDPSPPDMIETIITLEPSAWWTRRRVRFDDAVRGTSLALDALVAAGHLAPEAARPGDLRDRIVNGATMTALTEFDRTVRRFVHRRRLEHEPELERGLSRWLVDQLLASLVKRRLVAREPTAGDREDAAAEVGRVHGRWLRENASAEEISAAARLAGKVLAGTGVLPAGRDVLDMPPTGWERLKESVRELLGQPAISPGARLAGGLEEEIDRAVRERVKVLDWEIQDFAVGTYLHHGLEALVETARVEGVLVREPAAPALAGLREPLEPGFAKGFFLWKPSKDELLQELDSELQFPGWGNIWTQPIINRIDMLATGVRTMIGVKVFGDDLQIIQQVSEKIAGVLKQVPGAVDVFPDQVVGENYLEIDIDRQKAARFGINVGDIQDVIEVAMGGKLITMTVEGRQRFPVRVRYHRDYRSTREEIERILVTASGSLSGMGSGSGVPEGTGAAAGTAMGMGTAGPTPSGRERVGGPLQVPLAQVADIRVVEGPSMIKSENGLLRSYVQLNVRDRDLVGFVEEAQREVARRVDLPAGFYLEWSGQFEHQVRARRTLTLIVPLVILVIFVILYMTYHDLAEATLVMIAVPGALAGGVIFQYLFGYNFSVAVWVGYIACFGMATETGIVMVVYLKEALHRHGGLAAMKSEQQIRDVILEGAVHRLRPKLLTEGTTIVGLVPMLWASGAGAEVIRPMAAPVLGGILAADEVIDIFLPVLYSWVMIRRWRQQGLDGPEAGTAPIGEVAP